MQICAGVHGRWLERHVPGAAPRCAWLHVRFLWQRQSWVLRTQHQLIQRRVAGATLTCHTQAPRAAERASVIVTLPSVESSCRPFVQILLIPPEHAGVWAGLAPGLLPGLQGFVREVP